MSRGRSARYGTTTTRSISGICSPNLAHPCQAVDLLPGVAVAVSAEENRGRIWPKRSSTPLAPKSGEQDDQTAPTLAAASIAMTVSGMFGRKPATRSPARTPCALSAPGNPADGRDELDGKSAVRWRPRSFQNTSASRSSSKRSRFSAKLSRAPVNQRGPSSGPAAPSGRAPPPRRPRESGRQRPSATTRQNHQTSAQNDSGRSTDHLYTGRKVLHRSGAGRTAVANALQECGEIGTPNSIRARRPQRFGHRQRDCRATRRPRCPAAITSSAD